MRAAAGDPVRPVVIAYDGSEHARAAVEHAATLLRPCPAVVVCVWAPLALAASAATLGAPPAGARGLDAAARDRAEQLAAEDAVGE